MTFFGRQWKRYGEQVDVFRGAAGRNSTGGRTAPTWTNIGDGVAAVVDETNSGQPLMLAGGEVATLDAELWLAAEDGSLMAGGDIVRRRLLAGRYYEVLQAARWVPAPSSVFIVPVKLLLSAPEGVLP